jgi:excinuclease UvrABC nuclease subunit
MKKSAYITIYPKPGKTNINSLMGKSGVYFIKKKGDTKPCYVGRSSYDLYKTITRHFQSWQDPNQQRVVYSQRSIYQVRVIICSANDAIFLERLYILKHRPKDNIQKYQTYAFDAAERPEILRRLDKADPFKF